MRIFPLSENAVTVEFGNAISLEFNRKAISLAENLQKNPFPGFIEAVPAYSSVTIFYDPISTRNYFPQFSTASEVVTHFLQNSLTDLSGVEEAAQAIEIPVNFDAESSLDLEYLAEFSGLSSDNVISIFLERTYRVYMIGFLPGFAYMGDVDERIAAPRRPSPRLKVPKGSVGIGGRQTGIYPLESPGGWQIIGRAEMEMFTPDADAICPLNPGDNVCFVRA